MLEKACFAELCLIISSTSKSPRLMSSFLCTYWCIRYENVAFLECDLGQSEFTPGGMVSLHVLSQPVFGKASPLSFNAYFSIESSRTPFFTSF